MKNNYRLYIFLLLHAILSFLSIRIIDNDYHLIISNLFISVFLYLVSEIICNKKLEFKYVNKFLLLYLINLLTEIIIFQLLQIGFLRTQFVSYIMIFTIELILMKKKNYDYEKFIPYLFLLNIAFIFLLSSPNSPIGTTNSLTDSSVFRYIGLLMTENKIPYLDVFDHKGIFLYFLNYLGCLLNPKYGIWFIELILLFITLVFSYKTVRIYTNKLNSIIAVLLSYIPLIYTFECGNMTEELSLPFIVISLYLFLRDWQSNKSVGNKNAIIIGMCCSAVLLLKPNLISLWVCLSIFLFINYLKNKDYKRLLWLILSFVTGIFIFALPFLIYLIYNGAFNAFIYDYLIFNFTYSVKHGSVLMIDVISVFLDISKYVFIILISLICFSCDKSKREIALFNIFYLLVTFFIIVMPKVTYAHYGMNIIPTFLIGFGYLIDYLDKKLLNSINNKKIKKILILLVFYSVTFADIKHLSEQIKNQISGYNGYYNIENLIKSNSKKDDNVLVYGNEVILYLKTDRYTKNKYPYQFPISDISSKVKEEFKNTIKKDKPDLIIVRKDFNDKMKDNIDFIEGEYHIIEDKDITYNLYIKNN